ncbi:TAP-like protein-domain-containing protein [Aspergillus pseudonomiae]|uniref:TAP-like protein-domain-containing protein n=1 Tax=Aspergillus pseudonomiae TaxID=1506151 RepID=A0A5N6I646_9EURO|nr:TAP-like protein-domain-containing protein [Aspergillus pseudonomiae]KAB8262181.1 TAP-like protein-domain-containing protein [Aspergillus pseudonomiae]KAE8401613.1 TAP-like protein-domain-containing protein [Aspergillus pseudonomiae]
MYRHLHVLCALLIGVAQGTPLTRSPTHHARNQQIQWNLCEPNGTEATECATFPVPLDYTNEASTATLNLELTRIRAPNSPSRGSVFLNFGGPGDNGKLGLATYGPMLQAATGGYHDLVVITPRGTGKTILFSCYATDEERAAATKLYPSLAGNASDVALGYNNVSSRVFADNCYASQNKTGQLMSSAFAARDYMRVIDALGEDGLLRYWGLSYGTVLGATIASMFPDRIGRVVLDGVANPHEYQLNRDLQMLVDTDKVLTGFCEECVATPDKCPLARDRTASEVEEAIYGLIDHVKFNPILIPVAGTPTILDYTTLKTQVFSVLYSPTGWDDFSTFLNNLITGKLEEAGEYLTKITSAPPSLDAEAQYGIKCSDSFRTDNSEEDVLSLIKQRHELSRIGGDVSDYVLTRCAEWKIQPKERYTGDFQATTRNPILVIGNSGDPVTPLAAARNVSAGFANSVVLEHGGYGHASFAQASLCTAKAARAYFMDGTLPEPGTKCEIDTTPFSGDNGWKKVLKELAADSK